MGLLSKLQKIGDAVESINESAASLGKSTVTDYGEPAYYLYTTNKLADIHRRIDITDEEGNIKYYTKSTIFALKGETDVMDANDNVIAHLEKRPFSLHEKHFVTMADGLQFTLSNEMFHVIKDITNIEGLGWQMRGNMLGLSFNLVDDKGEPVASIGQKMLSIHDKYSVGIFKPEYEQIIVTILIQLQKMIEAREDNN